MANPLLPDELWEVIEPLLPKWTPSPKGGQPPVPDRDDADPILGSMSDHAELMDQIVEDAMRHREQQPWRLAASE